MIQRDAPGHRLALGALFLLAAVLTCRQAGSLDTGFHLRAGEHILAGNGWPLTDPFTYTINDHPYIDTSWGYQVVISLVQRVWDAPGLVLFHAALVLITFLAVYRTARLAGAGSAVLVVLLAAGVVASEMRYELRPELVSWLLLAATLHLLHRRAEGLASSLWLLPVIHLAWANMHSLFILGWAAIGCVTAGLWARERTLDRRLAGWGLASVAVALINPYGWRGMIFPFTLATRMQEGNLFGQTIGEFVSPFDLKLSDQFPFYPRLPIWTFRALGATALAALVVMLWRRRFHAAALTALFAALSFQMVRNIPLLVVGALPAVAAALTPHALPGGRPPRPRRRLAALAAPVLVTLVCIGMGLRVINDAYYVDSRRPERFGLGWSETTLPIGIAGYMNKEKLTGRVLNHLNFGGYLMWARHAPVFIDGRLEVAGEAFFQQYRAVLDSESAMEAAVARYGIQSLAFPYVIAPRLTGRISKDGRWRLASMDAVGALYIRSDQATGARRDRVASAAPRYPEAAARFDTLPGLGGAPRVSGVGRWLSGFVRRQGFPAEDFNRGIFHLYSGDLEKARAFFASALLESGGAYYEIYGNLGAVLFRMQRFTEAAACYRIVLQDDPANRIARERSASLPG